HLGRHRRHRTSQQQKGGNRRRGLYLCLPAGWRLGLVNDHDAIEVRTYDGGTWIRCACDRTFDGPRAREEHETHHRLERDRVEAMAGIAAARAALKGEAG